MTLFAELLRHYHQLVQNQLCARLNSISRNLGASDIAPGAPVSDPARNEHPPETRRIGDWRFAVAAKSKGIVRHAPAQLPQRNFWLPSVFQTVY